MCVAKLKLGIDPNEPIDTYVTDVRLTPCNRIAGVAVLFDLLTTRTRIKLITNFDGLKDPFSSSGFKHTRPRKRKDVVLQTLKVVSHEFILVSLCEFIGAELPTGAGIPTSSSSAPDHFPQRQ